MRLLFVTHYFHPEVGAAQTRILELAEALRRARPRRDRPHGLPELPRRRDPPPVPRPPLPASSACGGLRVVRTAVYPAPNRGVGAAAAQPRCRSRCSVAARRAGAPGRADVVIVETPPLFTAVAGVACRRSSARRCCSTSPTSGPTRRSSSARCATAAVIAAARALERFAYRHADVIAVPTPGLERVAARARPSGPSSSSSRRTASTRRASRSTPTRAPVPRRVVYCGTIGMGHAVGTLIEAARHARARRATATSS